MTKGDRLWPRVSVVAVLAACVSTAAFLVGRAEPLPVPPRVEAEPEGVAARDTSPTPVKSAPQPRAPAAAPAAANRPPKSAVPDPPKVEPVYAGPVQLLRQFEGHKGRVMSVAFTPDGRHILSGSFDKTVCLWDVGGGVRSSFVTRRVAPPGTIGGDVVALAAHNRDHVWCVAVTPDGRHVLAGCSGDDGLNDRTAEVAKDVFGPLGGVASHIGRDRRSSLRMWDVATGHEEPRFGEFAETVCSVAVSVDGKRVLFGTGGRAKAVLLWDLEARREQRRFQGHTDCVSAVALSPDGEFVLSGGYDKTVRVWNLHTGLQQRVLTGHEGTVHAVAYSPDGRRVLSAGDDRTVRLWDVKTGTQVRQFRGHTKPVRTVTFSPDGRFALSGGEDATIRVWAVESGREVRQLAGHRETVWSVSFSKDGRYLVSGGGGTADGGIKGGTDNTVILWGPAGAAAPAAPSPKPASPVAGPKKSAVHKTAVLGGPGGGPFEDRPQPRAFLTGFRVTTGRFANETVIRSVQPLYTAPDGRRVPDGKVYGEPSGKPVVVEAPPGYAVGALRVKGGPYVNGFSVVFLRVRGNGLDPRDWKETAWGGGRGGGQPTLVGGDGGPVVGICGRSGSTLDAIGLLVAGP